MRTFPFHLYAFLCYGGLFEKVKFDGSQLPHGIPLSVFKRRLPRTIPEKLGKG